MNALRPASPAASSGEALADIMSQSTPISDGNPAAAHRYDRNRPVVGVQSRTGKARESFPSGLIPFGLLTLLPCIGTLHSWLADARKHNSESEL